MFQNHYISLFGKEYIVFNTASASKVGKFKPILGELKKLKGPLMGIFVFKYSNVKVRPLETTLDAFCERSFSSLDATNAAI